ALNLLGAALIKVGDDSTAVQALRSAVALVPSGWCEPYGNLAQAYAALKDTTGAAWATAMVGLCDGRPTEASELLQPLVGGPMNRDALLGLGQAAEALGDTAAAISFYSRVYAADPSDFAAITALNRLGASAPAASPSADPRPSADPSAGPAASAPAPAGED
ncbi:MAG TPA: tetratricopeptide repeat protein, partial [Candidatus Limnocylindrales bacterium]